MTADRLRAALILPGRGSYAASSLGTLPPDHPMVDRAESIRAELGLDSLLALDAADTFEPSVHLRPANASPLTFLASLLDAERAAVDHRIVAVIGNSLGWYTALTVTDALDFDDGFRLVQGVALLQEGAAESGASGGQLIYPRVDADWQPVADYADALDAALNEGTGEDRAFTSVDLGAYVVLAASEAGIARLLALLPPVRVGERQYPLRLAYHGPYHTPLLAGVAEGASALFSGLDWRAPRVTLIDGRGVRFTPWSTNPAELARYTLGEQIVSPYNFSAGARVALREYAPDVLVLTGPGNTLGGVAGQIIVSDGFRGIRTRADFEATQAGPEPPILSMSR